MIYQMSLYNIYRAIRAGRRLYFARKGWSVRIFFGSYDSHVAGRFMGWKTGRVVK